ncbi:beta-1,4-galactosyltransferase 4 [Lampetra fluviatilis]
MGKLALSFPSGLTLAQVAASNRAVSRGGRARPSACAARQRVAVLVPHRNREAHLVHLLNSLHPLLQRQQLDYAIYVVHQAGTAMFNRAKLLNVGFLEALSEAPWDCVVLHDVDLIPEDDRNFYGCGSQPRHLVVGRNFTKYQLRYKGYFGGVSAMTVQQFRLVNGFSNRFWGWGGEDDDLRLRVEHMNMTIFRPPAAVARYTMIFHSRNEDGNKVNQNRMKLLRDSARLLPRDGLNSCSYTLLSKSREPLYTNVTVDIGTPES